MPPVLTRLYAATIRTVLLAALLVPVLQNWTLQMVVYDTPVPYFIFSYENRRSRISNYIEHQFLAHLGALQKMEI